jgi:F0F1-type ATP synthase assembly protein I
MQVVREAAPYLGLGTALAVTVLGGFAAGYWIDGRLGTRPVFLLLGAAFGLFAGFYGFFRQVTGRRR